MITNCVILYCASTVAHDSGQQTDGDAELDKTVVEQKYSTVFEVENNYKYSDQEENINGQVQYSRRKHTQHIVNNQLDHELMFERRIDDE